jgi:hypothetical protein
VSIQDLGSIGEVIAAMATVATLVYLALQIRQNSAVVRTSNYWQLAAQFKDFNHQMTHDADLMGIYQRGISDYGNLSDIDRGRFHMLLSGLFSTYQIMWQLDSRGLLDADMYQGQFAGMEEMFGLPGIREWWAAESKWYAPGFRDYVTERFVPAEAQ